MAAGGSTSSLESDNQRWRAVTERDWDADGAFVYAVRTTGVFCRPSCGARRPLRGNVSLYPDPAKARAAGFRACKRCKPGLMPPREHHKALVVEACRRIERAEREPSARELAEAAGLSHYHFGRVFKALMGITPKQYAMAHRARIASKHLRRSKDVTSAIYDSGYGAPSRFYDSAGRRHGMTAQELRNGGHGIEIRHAFGDSSLGLVSVAATSKGICAVLSGTSRQELAVELRNRSPNAVFQEADGGSDFERWVEHTVEYLDGSCLAFDLPLDLRGTAFQERVWIALLEIPNGQTASYAEVARRIGRPKAARAVASACAANPVAVVVPCHRVIRTDGRLSNYRWGVDRKRRLLERESLSKRGSSSTSGGNAP